MLCIPTYFFTKSLVLKKTLTFRKYLQTPFSNGNTETGSPFRFCKACLSLGYLISPYGRNSLREDVSRSFRQLNKTIRNSRSCFSIPITERVAILVGILVNLSEDVANDVDAFYVEIQVQVKLQEEKKYVQ